MSNRSRGDSAASAETASADEKCRATATELLPSRSTCLRNGCASPIRKQANSS